MNNILQNLSPRFRSGNLKSKTCPESYRRIQNRKLVATIVVGVTFALCGAVAAAQQPKKVPTDRIFVGAAILPIRGLASRHFGKGCEISVTSKEKTSCLSIATPRERAEPYPEPRGRTRATEGRCPCLSHLQPAIRAAKQATKTIPIVMVTTQDPVATGYSR